MNSVAELNATVNAQEQEIVDTLRALVKIPSLTGEEREIGEFVAEKCRDMELSVEVIEAEPGRPNVVAVWDTGVPGRSLLLVDHLDTFPPGEIDAWSHHPYAADVVDGYV